MIRKTLLYMENDIYGPDSKHELSDEVLAECINKHKLCAFWAVIGGEIRRMDVHRVTWGKYIIAAS